MANRKRKNEAWKQFEERIVEKRNGAGGKNEQASPEVIMVQRMSEIPSGRLKKFEPLEPREFVPFSEFTCLSLENIKTACEEHYSMPTGTCDVLASNQGPSCTRFEQIKGKKIYLIRFLQADPEYHSQRFSTTNEIHHGPVERKALTSLQSSTAEPSKFAQSVSLADLMKAGKIIKKRIPDKLNLEQFDIETMVWKDHAEMNFLIDEEPFEQGFFRKAYKAVEYTSQKMWVVKRYKEQAIKNLDHLNLGHEEHARKQVQMHTVARNLAQRLEKNAPEEFGETFKYGKVFFSLFKGEPITLEEYVAGDFIKYVNNDGNCGAPENEDLIEVYEKAETLVHFSNSITKKKMMVLDIQGSGYQLYDPEIATKELLDTAGDIYFCSGNLTDKAIDNFIAQHKCNQFCIILGLKSMKSDLSDNSMA